MDDFDALYRSTADYFGAEPESSLVRFIDLLDPTRPVLDVGCGQGRNSILLARRGFKVHALDPSAVAVEQVAAAADKHGLDISTTCGLFQDLRSDRRYGTILIFGLIPLLDRSGINGLAPLVMTHLDTRGLVFVTAFGVWDPDFPRRSAAWRAEGPNSLRSPDGRLRTYLEPGELTSLFPEFSVIHSWEGLTPEHRHGDGPLERHGLAEAVLRLI